MSTHTLDVRKKLYKAKAIVQGNHPWSDDEQIKLKALSDAAELIEEAICMLLPSNPGDKAAVVLAETYGFPAALASPETCNGKCEPGGFFIIVNHSTEPPQCQRCSRPYQEKTDV